jgi:nucleotide-binding universal stress UspA family protein
MTIRTILVSLDGSESSPATLNAAFGIAKRFGVHVDVLHVRPDSLAGVPAIGEGMSGSMADRISVKAERQAGDRAQRAHALFEEICQAHGVPVIGEDMASDTLSATWIERVGRKHMVMKRLGRVHDLIVLGQPSNPKAMTESLTVNALFETGRPVLVVPPTVADKIGRRIAVAWNGSAECARALGGATNFFTDADTVVILTAHGDETPVSVVTELQTYLRHHGIKAETRIFANLGRRHLDGRTLLAECAENGADMLVLGGTQIGPLKELMLGSTTRHVLEAAQIPLLIGH